MNNIGVIILAAGSSSRMTGSKQLLHFKGETLLRKSVRTALSVSDKVVVVLGQHYLIHQHELGGLPVDYHFNLDWNKGMGNSLKFGLAQLHKSNPDLEAVIIMVCDQPFVSEKLLQALIDAYNENHSIVTSFYSGTKGVPALFDRQYFKKLLKIPDKKGAKVLFSKYPTHTVTFNEGSIDIDTDDDWRKLIESL